MISITKNKKTTIKLIIILITIIILFFSSEVNVLKEYTKNLVNRYIVNIINKVEKYSLPRYSLKNLEEISSQVLSRKKNNFIIFEFITDSHYDETSGFRDKAIKHFREVKEMSRLIGSDFVIHGGDIIDGYDKKNKSIMYLDKVLGELCKNNQCPTFYAVGNHDDNSYYNVRNTPQSHHNVISKREFYNITIGKYIKGIIVDEKNPEGMYYYKDFPNKKLRIIVLNTNDIPEIYHENGKPKYNGILQYGISNEQLNWVANKALDFSNKEDKKEWKTIFFSHVSINKKINYDKSIPNGDIMMKVIESFKYGKKYKSNKTKGDFGQYVNVDFSSQGSMDVIAVINGHVHMDNSDKVNGIMYISTLNSVPIQISPYLAPKRYIKTFVENAFDIFSIDTNNRKIYIDRYGAGSDRVFDY
ncbi:3',5'-cyclic adenosine monophosphate phosphodiesterase CpdA [Clostridium acetireducens DSM 10703]|uniref:3',5'-cyclic adenosine monophosphate phosphodiesterase CpdA n=1 Tax=Clostridium acetireducens DSM 10703 TaxID=1121290 RepID=A0A1E8F0N5_9CLOT|nr:metallophosphoesterase [Clostridium acetireducens]OFI06978.1 3',5'-cyclic adenosine monophosphate phosphodiesterase CpdA [Clostridium acetireducens DSM 10703]